MKAREKLKEVCSELLRQVRQQMATTNGEKPAGKLERGVAPGSFLHHLATAKHHVSVRNGDDFTDTEILQQVCAPCTLAYELACRSSGYPAPQIESPCLHGYGYVHRCTADVVTCQM